MHTTYAACFQPFFCLEYPYPHLPLNTQAKPSLRPTLPCSLLHQISVILLVCYYTASTTQIYFLIIFCYKRWKQYKVISQFSASGFWAWVNRVFYLRSHWAETEVTAGTVNLSEAWACILFQAYQEAYLLAGFSPFLFSCWLLARSHSATRGCLPFLATAVHKV